MIFTRRLPSAIGTVNFLVSSIKRVPTTFPLNIGHGYKGCREPEGTKGVERPDDAEVADSRYMSAYAFFHASPAKESNPKWEHLMTTEEEEWAFLDDL